MTVDKQTLTFNQRINFYIIRKMCLFTSKEKRVHAQIYDYLDMSRTRYERVIRGDSVRFTSEEEEKWIAKGLPKAVFTGKVQIEIPYVVQVDWERLFDLRSDSRFDKTEAKEYKRVRAEINKHIRQAREQPPQNELLAKIIHFIEKREDTASHADILLAACTMSLGNIKVEDLQQASTAYLGNYISTLQAQLNLARAVKLVESYKKLK